MSVSVSVTLDGNGNAVTASNPLATALPATFGTDHSRSVPSLLNVLATVAPNASRVGFYWQNQSAADIQIVLDHDTSGTNYTVIITATGAAPGGPGNVQGADNSFAQMGIRHVGQIRICGVAGSQIAVGEY